MFRLTSTSCIFKLNIKVEFNKRGIPWSFYHSLNPRFVPPVPFEPLLRDVSILKKRPDESIDIYCHGHVLLSNGCGHTLPEGFLNLKMDGTVRYFLIYGQVPRPRTHLEALLIYRNTNLEPREWGLNVPTWKPLFYKESRQGALCAAWCLTELQIFPRELIEMIAKYVYNSFSDLCWLLPLLNKSDGGGGGDEKEPSTKRHKKNN